MYILIVLVVTTTGSLMKNISFNSNTSCLEAMSKILEFEQHSTIKTIKARCVKE
jgi:hypothetical protein